MLFYLFICLALFAVGDILGVATKAKVSAVFVALLLFLAGFMTGLLPKDIIEQAGLSQIGKWAAAFVVFHMGTTINLKQLAKEWRTVVLAIISMLIAMISILLTIPIIGKEAAIVSIPVINGGVVATKIMSDAATGAGFAVAAALATIGYAVQKFVGTPPASFFGLREAEDILKEYRANRSTSANNAGKAKDKNIEASDGGFAKRHKRYFTDFTCLAVTGLFAYIASVLEKYTGLSYSIWCLLLGATVSYFKAVPEGILIQGKASGLLNMAIFASIIPSLAKIDVGDLGKLGFQLVVVFAATLIGLFACVFLTPLWKLVGSKNLSIGICMGQLLGFPATFLIANEVASAVAKDDEEKEVVLNKIMPAYVVSGFATVTSISIIIAGIFSKFL